MDLLDHVNDKVCDALHCGMQYFDNPLMILISVAIVVALSLALVHKKG